MSINRGKFIVLEGIEGSGKSLQTKILVEYLLEMGIPIYKTKEASDGPIGKILHQEYLSGKRKADNRLLNLLYVADRLDHITNDQDGMIKFIDDGTTVVSDRYYLSSAAYHSSFFFDEPDEQYNAMVDIIEKNKINRDLLKPDITILLDVRPEVAWKRVLKRGDNKEIFDNYHTLQKLRICYDKAMLYLSDIGDNIIKIDGNDSPSEVHNRIVSVINEIFMI